MRSVYKYEIPVTNSPSLLLPPHSEILHFGVQGSSLMIWALVYPQYESRELVQLRLVGTGHPIQEEQELKYIGTTLSGPYVWHLFQL